MLEKNPAFFSAEFRADLKVVAEAPDPVIAEIAKWLCTINSAKQLSDHDAWIPLLRKTGLVVEDLQKIIGPIFWIASRCLEKSVSMLDLGNDLIEAGVLTGATSEQTKQKILEIGKSIEPLIRKLEVESSPELPLLHIKSFKTRSIFVSEFTEEFEPARDKIQDYKPVLKSLHPRITLQLTFHEDFDPVGILLSLENVKELRTILELAEMQTKTSLQMLSPDKVVTPEHIAK